MDTGVAPLRESAVFQNLFVTMTNPVLGILVGVVVTVIIQSSSASSCVPFPTIFPSSSTRICSACKMVLIRCATMITVLSFTFSASAFRSAASVFRSSAEKLSSKIKIFGSFAIALAIARRCFCPPETLHETARKDEQVAAAFRLQNQLLQAGGVIADDMLVHHADTHATSMREIGFLMSL